MTAPVAAVPAATPLTRALEVIDGSGVLLRLDAWRREDAQRNGTGPGGRPRVIGDRAILGLWLALAVEDRAMTVRNMADNLDCADERTLAGLGIERPAHPNVDWYSMCWRSLHAVLDIIDPHPIRPEMGGDRRSLITKAVWETVVANRDREDCARKTERLHWFTNALVEGSVATLPREVRRRWKGNIAVDGTLVHAWGQRPVPEDSPWMHSEPDGGYYCRHGDHSDKKGNGDRVAWGWDATLVTQTPNAPGTCGEFPILALALSFDRPGFAPGAHATSALRSVIERKHPAGYAIGDRAYLPGAKPENYQLPVAALGYEHVGDYKSDMAAVTIAEQGAIQVDGAWYCPSMPKALVEATVDRGLQKIDHSTYLARIERRTRYLLSPNGRADDDGYRRYRCPAAGPSATVACPLKNNPDAKPGLTQVAITPRHPDKVCTQQSITIAPTVGAKWAQALQFKTEQWQAVYGMRNTVESWNAYLKDEAHGAMSRGGRRQVRGRTAANVFVAITVVAANLRRIKTWLRTAARKARATKTRTRRRDREGGWGEESPLRRASKAGPAPPAAA